jgi:hypothetical protein
MPYANAYIRSAVRVGGRQTINRGDRVLVSRIRSGGLLVDADDVDVSALRQEIISCEGPLEVVRPRVLNSINSSHAASFGVVAGGMPRRTNLGLYRLYLTTYFRDHPAVRRDMPLVIRQLQSSQPVVALEIYLYVNETNWELYETLQSDMLDHVYGVVPLFGLRCWQPQ